VKSLLLVGAVALCGAGCGPQGQGAANPQTAKEGPPLGAQATDFTLRDVDGKTVRLSDFSGQVVLIDFWATWCTPCEAEIPHLARIYGENKGRGFVVLAVSMDGPETLANVAPFARRYNLDFPVLLDEETKVVGIYNPKRTAPLSVLIDRKGQIARVRSGYDVGDEKLIEADVLGLL
jgi:peroxiredoxin